MKQSTQAAIDAKQLQRDQYYMKLAVAVIRRKLLRLKDRCRPRT